MAICQPPDQPVVAFVSILACRRLPVVDEEDVLIGIISLDDIHQYHAEEGSMMSVVLRRENPDNLADA